MAAERGNRSVAYLQDALHPAVLRQIQQTVKAAEAAGKWVGCVANWAVIRWRFSLDRAGGA